MRTIRALAALMCLAVPYAHGEARLDHMQKHEVALIVVPLTGSGTYADPRRPALAVDTDPKLGEGLVSWTWQAGDNGQVAIVQIVARDKATLRRFTTDFRVQKAFERGKHAAAEVERELKLVKRDFSLLRQEMKKP